MIHRQRFFNLFRCHVMRRAHHVPDPGQRNLSGGHSHYFGNAEIGDLHPALFVHQEIFRFDVAVDDAFVVGELQRLADLRYDGQRLFRR